MDVIYAQQSCIYHTEKYYNFRIRFEPKGGTNLEQAKSNDDILSALPLCLIALLWLLSSQSVFTFIK